MKINYIKGFDRIALLLAIPMALWGAYFDYATHIKSQRVDVYLTEDETNELEKSYYALPEEKRVNIFAYCVHMQIFDFPKVNGVIADGEKELIQQAIKNPFAKRALDRAFKEGGDPSGTLVDSLVSGRYYLLPRASTRLMVRFFIIICFAVTTILAVGVSTRIISRVFSKVKRLFIWIKKGFLSS